jgi:predicted RNA-binding Zn-ribbon protein involved in translation (DUF1610 family)
MTMRTVNADTDKPHRCPECWKIPEQAHIDGRAFAGRTYQCDDCGVQWVAPDTRETAVTIRYDK